MRVVLTGATGMVGRGVLLTALEAPEVTGVLAVGRSPSGLVHPKLVERAHADFSDFSPLKPLLAGHDAMFWCMGVSVAGMSEADYTRMTYDFTIAGAEAMASANPESVFTYVSGEGTDREQSGRTMWARVKGRTEATLLELPFKAAYMFRPGLIRADRGEVSKTALYRRSYAVMRPLMGLAERVAPDRITSTTRVGKAMLECVRSTPPGHTLAARDINSLAAAWDARANAT